jgi:hypothetical protein
MCEAFVDADRKATTRTNCAAGFRASGISPFAPEIPLASQFVVDPQASHLGVHQQSPLSANLLTGEEGLNATGKMSRSNRKVSLPLFTLSGFVLCSGTREWQTAEIRRRTE